MDLLFFFFFLPALGLYLYWDSSPSNNPYPSLLPSLAPSVLFKPCDLLLEICDYTWLDIERSGLIRQLDSVA